jgi:hypothetical protein
MEEVAVKKMMKSVVLGATVLGVVGTMAPAMAASSLGDSHHGGCFFNTDQQATATNGQNQGVIGDLSATTDGSGAPTGATVTCTITVNGLPQVSKTYSGNPVQAGSDQIVFTASDTDSVQLCETFVYSDLSSESDCGDATSQQIPPQQVIDAINFIFDTVNGVLSGVDTSALCTVTKALAPLDLGGVVVIAADGSLTISDPLGLIVVTNTCS